MKQGRIIVHTRSYNKTMGNEERLPHAVTMQTIGYETRKTHCSHRELQCKKQWSYNANNG
ncbi:hypothetical protein KSS87_016717 [Heliosperma pusillum]|nr:hypothetical protein KSS87_016717 [Heliosperma pusillum]